MTAFTQGWTHLSSIKVDAAHGAMLPMVRALSVAVENVVDTRRTSRTVDIHNDRIQFRVTRQYVQQLYDKHKHKYTLEDSSETIAFGPLDLADLFYDEWNVDMKMNDNLLTYIYGRMSRRCENFLSADVLYRNMIDWLPSDPRRTALIIVDVQNDFITGSLPVKNAVNIIPKINDLREKIKFDLVVHTLDWHPEGHCSFDTSHKNGVTFDVIDYNGGKQTLWPVHCVEDSLGSDLHPALNVLPTDFSVRKGMSKDVDSYSGFVDNNQTSETGLRVFLRKQGVGRVCVVGIAYDYCVGSTALHAATYGFYTIVVKDCTASASPESEKEMDTRLRAANVFVKTSEETIGMLNNRLSGAMANQRFANYLTKQSIQTAFPGALKWG